MKNIFPKLIFSFSLLFLGALSAQAMVLEDVYLLTEASVVSVDDQTDTASVNLEGIVYSAVTGGDPSVAEVFYRSQEDGTQTDTNHQNFSSNANGVFQQVISGLECDETYYFWLFEAPDVNIVRVELMDDTTIELGFSVYINCDGPASVDIMAPSSADTEILAGVNWGDVSTTSNSISIVDAYVIPLVNGGPKTFKIEYGIGESGGNGQITNDTFLGYSAPITLNPPYDFSRQIGALTPNTNYYFNIHEINGNVATNMFVYGFATTSAIDSNDALNYTFPNATSVHFYGNLTSNIGLPITIEIHGSADPDSAVLQAHDTVTQNSIQYGTGFYEHTFTGLTANTQYFVLLRHTTSDAVLTTPVAFTTPDPYVPDPVNPNPVNPDYDGLVPCSGIGADKCEFNELIDLINRVVNFLIVFIAFPIIAIVAAWAGFNLIISGGSTEKVSYAKSMLWKVVVGLVIALLCWAIIKLLLVTLGYVPPPGSPEGSLWCVFGITPQCPS